MKKAIIEEKKPVNKITYSYDIESCDDIREYINDEDRLAIKFDITEKDKVCHSILHVNPSHISCGIFELEGISQFEIWLETNKELTTELEKVLTEAINEIKENGRYCFCLCSNNTITPLINQVLTNISSTMTDIRENPNSGNDILIWII